MKIQISHQEEGPGLGLGFAIFDLVVYCSDRFALVGFKGKIRAGVEFRILVGLPFFLCYILDLL